MITKFAAEATRIAAGDDRVGYDGPEMAFHWATALLVVTLYALAETWGFLPRGAGRGFMITSHISLGILLAAVIVLRLLWRLGPGRRVRPLTTGLVEKASQAVHYLLYGLLFAQVVIGFLYRWADHAPLAFFGLFSIPPAVDLHAQRHLVGGIHNWVAQIILVLAGLHAAAALFHHYVLRDDVLLRMLPGRPARRAERDAPDPRQVAERGAD